VAILLVVLSHFTAARGFPPRSWWTLVFQGNLGVRMFFVLSGFLITYLLLLEADRHVRASLGAFYIRRGLRIFPVYFLYLGVVAIIAAAGLYTDTPGTWIGSLTFTRNLIGQAQSLTGHYWSLSVEEQFYLVWPVTLVTLKLWRRPALAAGILFVPIALTPIFRSGLMETHWTNPLVARALNLFSTARYADSLAVGCLGAFLYRRYRDPLQRVGTPGVLSVALAVFVGAASAENGSHLAGMVLPLIEAIALICAIWVTLDRRAGPVYWLLNCKPVVWLGLLSYSLYVWQELFLSWAAGPKLAALPIYDWRVWWVPAVACACVSYYAVERPILRFKDRLRTTLIVERPRPSDLDFETIGGPVTALSGQQLADARLGLRAADRR
jgi:peptidoglycan/LPS O-acetylase OafA/YrhL